MHGMHRIRYKFLPCFQCIPCPSGQAGVRNRCFLLIILEALFELSDLTIECDEVENDPSQEDEHDSD
jgi:hypothetical protein